MKGSYPGEDDGSKGRERHSVDPLKVYHAEVPTPIGDLMHARDAQAGNALMSLLHNDDGYLKIRPDMLGRSIHLTWTWVYGKDKGCYVYVVHDRTFLGDALELLLMKMNQVHEGTRRPTPDKRRDPLD